VLTTTVDDIQHIESQSLYGIVVIKVFPQLAPAQGRGADYNCDNSRQLPLGTTPPLVISYTASNVPVIRVGWAGKSLRAKPNDLAQRGPHSADHDSGASVLYPYGGKMRYVSVI
jgi:hypothetical protein